MVILVNWQVLEVMNERNNSVSAKSQKSLLAYDIKTEYER
jgi:hypothetical protein